MIKLLDLYQAGQIRQGALEFLYELMQEREPEVNISHRDLPSFEQHRGFVTRRPYRFWYMIEAEIYSKSEPGQIGPSSSEESITQLWIGYISVTQANEIGLVLRKPYRGCGYGPAAIAQLMQLHRPNPPLEGSRNGHWLANIAPTNEHSKHIFQKLGFRKIQETYSLEEGDPHGNEKDSTPPA